jgi:hypothetical protein
LANYKTYAQFNTVALTGRVFNAEVVKGKNGEFLAVTLITNLQDDDNGVTVTFNTSNGLMSLFNKGYLPNGRIVTVTGNLANVSETYTDKTGTLKLRQRPQLHLVQTVTHVGPMPSDKAPKADRKGQTVVRPSDAAKAPVDSVESVEDAITDEEAYAAIA